MPLRNPLQNNIYNEFFRLLYIHLTDCNISPFVNAVFNFSCFFIISIGIILSMPFVFQIFTLKDFLLGWGQGRGWGFVVIYMKGSQTTQIDRNTNIIKIENLISSICLKERM